ncbi:DNA methyltransferase [Streptomyces sp. NPDC005336]|uniref:DNA methyltransferase n=1 Tax=Streptomyces sp. NPDC005336 TaxID=3157035 RepID=UPI0033A43DDD
MNRLYYGDNLDVLREHIPDGSVDLVYLDPPFNSNRSYNVIFGNNVHDVNDAAAQIQAFGDTWRWTPVTEQQFQLYVGGQLPVSAADALTAFRALLGESDAMAYLVNMAPRLVELSRVLAPTGSLYLHCDSIMSHYLKVLLDAIFGISNFRNEIIWKRTSGHSDAGRYGRVHDVILFYTKGKKSVWNKQYQPYGEEYVDQYYRYVEGETNRKFMSGDLSAAGLAGGGYEYVWNGIRRVWRCPEETMKRYEEEGRIFYTRNGMPRMKRYLDESKGMPAQDVWADIEPLRSWHQEKLAYPTQKPVELLERIIRASSNEGDVVLDPFAGCGTTVDAAQSLKRRWIGIDITFIAVDLMEKRLIHVHGPGVAETYEILGIPRDLGGAKALFRRSAFDFERWAVSQINAQPNEKQVGDKGVDGVARFYLDKNKIGKIIASVKGGKIVTPSVVRDLLGTVESQKAQMGVLITMTKPSAGVLDAANHGGTYKWPLNNQIYPRVQVITVSELLGGARPNTPPPLLPYIQAKRAEPKSTQIGFDELASEGA